MENIINSIRYNELTRGKVSSIVKSNPFKTLNKVKEMTANMYIGMIIQLLQEGKQNEIFNR